MSPRSTLREVALGATLLSLLGAAAVAALGYRDLASAWPLWLTLACLGAGVAAAARAGVRAALVVAAAPFVLAVDPLFGSAPPASAHALVADAVVAAVVFGLFAAAEYGLANPARVREVLDPRTRRFVAAGALAVPLAVAVARAVLGLGWITASPAFLVAATVWTVGGLACCGAVAGGFLARGAAGPAAVVFGAVVFATVSAADGAAAMVTELTLLGVGWFVPLGVAVAVGLAERRLRAAVA